MSTPTEAEIAKQAEMKAFQDQLQNEIRTTQTEPLFEQIKTLTDTIENLKLQFALDSNESNPNDPKTKGMTMARPENPDKFDGENRSDFRGFIAQIDNLFKLQPQAFPSDEVKIAYVGTLLSGKARVWFTPFIESPDKFQEILATYDTFKTHFKTTFGEADQSNVSATKLRLLRQGSGTVAAYFAEFNRLAADINWDSDAALIHAFRWGLSPEIGKMLVFAPTLPTKLSEFALVAINCDNRIRESEMMNSVFLENQRSIKSARSHANTFQAPGNPYANFQHSQQPLPPVQQSPNMMQPVPSFHGYYANPPNDMMDIDALRNQRPLNQRPPIQGRLTPQMRQYRMSNRLCIVCGDANHYKAQCPSAFRNQRNRTNQINAVHMNPVNAQRIPRPALNPAPINEVNNDAVQQEGNF